MKASPPPRILISAAQATAVEDLSRLLQPQGYVIVGHVATREVPDDVQTVQLILLDDAPGTPEALQVCRRLRARLGDVFVPILFLTGDAGSSAHLSIFE